jgi:sugar lactone lactonase YvrE
MLVGDGTARSQDGQGTAARFKLPNGVAVDSAGNVYVADTGNATIRMITPDGVTTTLAGTVGVSGVVLGTKPRFGAPRNLAVLDDSLVISDADGLVVLHHAVPPMK